MKRTRHNLGFTILELVLVLVIMAIVLAIAAPSLQAWRAGSELRYCAEDVVSATHWARSRAICEARTYVLVIDRQNGACGVRVMDGQTATNVAGEFGQPIVVTPPADISMRSMHLGNRWIRSIFIQPGASMRRRSASPILTVKQL